MAAVAKGGAASGLQQLTSLDLTQQQATLVLDLLRKHLPPQPHVFRKYLPPDYNRNGQLVLDPILIRKMGEQVEEKKLGSVDGIVNLQLCLSLAQLVASLPHLGSLKVEGGFPEEISREGCEQAMGVLFAALAAQGPSAVLSDLMLFDDGVYGTERVCRQLVHLLTSDHCKLEKLTLCGTGMRAEGMRHIAEALHTDSTLKRLEVSASPDVGDAGVEHLSAMLPSNATLENLHLKGIGMTGNGTRRLFDALSSPATRLKDLHLANIIDYRGPISVARELGGMLAHNRSLERLYVENDDSDAEEKDMDMDVDDKEGHVAQGLRSNSTLQSFRTQDKFLGQRRMERLFNCLATVDSTHSLQELQIFFSSKSKVEMPGPQHLALMLSSNRSLRQLGVPHARYSADDWATVILQALAANQGLKIFVCQQCRGVKGDKVLDALMDVVRTNTVLETFHLVGTPLHKAGYAEAVEEELQLNKEFRAALASVPASKPKSCRIVVDREDVGTLLFEIEELFKQRVEELPHEPEICQMVVKAPEDPQLGDTPIITTQAFQDICKKAGGDDKSLETFLGVGDKGWRAIAAYLDSAGEVIYYEELDFIVRHPSWFGLDILGHLVDIFSDESSQEGCLRRHNLFKWCFKKGDLSPKNYLPKNGFINGSDLENLLKKSAESIPGLDPTTAVSSKDLVRLMKLLNLCFEQTPGDPHTRYLLPAMFEDAQDQQAANGKRQINKCPDWKATTFLGRRLECADLHHTFLTAGFFPRLQVVLHNVALERNWASMCRLDKYLFIISLNGMEIVVEYSGFAGYFVDILVKSSHQESLEFVHSNIITVVRTFCASRRGCQGVRLVEAIIRPECVTSLTLCAYRRDQAITLDVLSKEMTRYSHYKHSWGQVKDEHGNVIHPTGVDEAQSLLEGASTSTTVGAAAVSGDDKVLDALMDVVRTNTVLETFHLAGTPLDEAGYSGAVEEELRLNKETRKDNLPVMDSVYEEHDGPTFSTPICAPAASEMVGSLRPDVVALGYTGFDDAFDSKRILFLHKVLEDGGQVQMAFMHPQGMCRVIGVGLPRAVVTVKNEDLTQVVVDQVTQEEWSRLWTDAVNQQLYSPIVLDVSGQDHPSALDVDVKLSSAESLQRFGLGVVGSDVAFVTCSPGETSSTNGQAMDIYHLTSTGQGNRGVNLSSNNPSTSTSDESLPINDEPSQVLKEAEVEKSLTIHVHFRIDATFVPELTALPNAHFLQLNSSLGTRMTIKFFHLTEFTPPGKGIDVTVDVDYGLRTLERILVADWGSSSTDACQSDNYGWYHDQHLASFEASRENASVLLDRTSWCLTGGNTPNNAGMLTTQTQETRGLAGTISCGASKTSIGATASGSSNESRQYASSSEFKSKWVGDSSRLAFLTKVYPTIKEEELWHKKGERERAEEAGVLSSISTKMWGHWIVLEDTAQEYSYTLSVSRNLYLLKKKPWKKSIIPWKKYRTEKYQQTVSQTFLVNHKFSNLLSANNNSHTWRLVKNSPPPPEVQQVIGTDQ